MGSITSPITTHVLDLSRGAPVKNLKITLYKLKDNAWNIVGEDVTNEAGRCLELMRGKELHKTTYKLQFHTETYYKTHKALKSFYPFIEVVFDCEEEEHYHIPLLLSPFGYSTYRGS